MSALAAPPPPRVVAIGGGTGLPVVLRGLRQVLFPTEWRHVPRRGRDRLTALVTVADDGGSSGRLREAYGVLAPGDIRNCLLALAEGDPALHSLFAFRFEDGDGLAGHSLGNLLLTALSLLEQRFPEAVERAGEILRTRGRVLPATADDVTLLAELEDGSVVRGEREVAAASLPIRRLRLLPEDAAALPQALRAVAAADLIVIGPGSLYTSLLPALLVGGLAEAIARSGARVALVMNLMTEPGETRGYSALDHLLALRRHAPGLTVHDVLLNTATLPDARSGEPVAPDAGSLERLGCRVLSRDLLAPAPQVRHDPLKLARALMEVAATARPCLEEPA